MSEHPTMVGDPTTERSPPSLVRGLSLLLTVLFGLGVTIGAGIYVLIGTTAARAGVYAPLAFMLAALVMAPTAASFAEFATRIPKSAGEAAYVRAGFGSNRLALLVGLLVVCVGVISAAAISRGSAGYIRLFVAAPTEVIVVAVVLTMGASVAWGILQSVALAGLMTLIEIGGLLVIIAVGMSRVPQFTMQVPETWSGLADISVWIGILSATLLAFFAFIGFESLANLAEEVKEPERTLPKAIFITLVISTLLYVLVAWIALSAVPRDELAIASAPLSLVFERITGASPAAISAIAIIATTNGIIIQLVMASRVIYGMADQGLLPSGLATISPRTHTPMAATKVAALLVLALALFVPLDVLAETTTRITLIIFALVNAALVLLKRRELVPLAIGFQVPIWIPAAGCALCVSLLAGATLL
jgi:basic amino acid/polyamine antiporter, APA family